MEISYNKNHLKYTKTSFDLSDLFVYRWLYSNSETPLPPAGQTECCSTFPVCWCLFSVPSLSPVRRPLQVSQESIINKMSPSNLACVFGVNLVWPRHGSISLTALTPINIFAELLIEHVHTVFGSRCPPAQVMPWRTAATVFFLLFFLTLIVFKKVKCKVNLQAWTFTFGLMMVMLLVLFIV